MTIIRTIILATILLVAGTLSTSASTLTPCSGSWDGPGKSTCEVLGKPGIVGSYINGFNFTKYGTPVFLFGITAYDYSNLFAVLPNGSLRYQPRSEVGQIFYSTTDPLQFAVWEFVAGEDEKFVIVGIEDLTSGDWDYNDHVVLFPTVPDVPEPASIIMVGLGLFTAAAGVRRRA